MKGPKCALCGTPDAVILIDFPAGASVCAACIVSAARELAIELVGRARTLENAMAGDP